VRASWGTNCGLSVVWDRGMDKLSKKSRGFHKNWRERGDVNDYKQEVTSNKVLEEVRKLPCDRALLRGPSK